MIECTDIGMSCPVSSRRSGNLLLILSEEVLKGAVVGSEVAYRVAELLVRTPPEDHRLDLAGLTGRGSNPGQAGQGVRGREPAPSVADLGQQPGRADGPRPRQAGEDGAVGV